jgi:cytochrome P450
MAGPWIIHRHWRFWVAPDAFVPSRWTGREDQPGAHYLPFGAGSRICLGAIFAQTEAMTLLGTLLSRCENVLTTRGPFCRGR